MRYYYFGLMLGVALVGLLVGWATFSFVIDYVPAPSQMLASSVALAFEGFIFGGAFQFLLEGRRVLHRDRVIRVKEYHMKLKRHVIDYWSSRSFERPQQLEGSPNSPDGLYIRFDLESGDDPDSRYLTDMIHHLKSRRYADALALRNQIKESLKSYNVDVAELENNVLALHSKARETGLHLENRSTMDRPSESGFNPHAAREYLNGISDQAAQISLNTVKIGVWSELSYYIEPWDRRVVAAIGVQEQIDKLAALLAEFAPKYSESKKTLNNKARAIGLAYESLKKKVVPIGYDIEESTFEGSCSYEDRIEGG
ncbi:MAG: hypothetical protein JRM99_07425 [Nitrososphaerota archaeon]|nr:hypothetical protein [Nitrososphaerota archaeon]